MRDIEALLRFLAERATMPFAWGSEANDCVSFAGAGARAQLGRNPFADLRWSGERGALRVIARVGGIEAGVDARLRATVPAFAARGDIAGVPDARFGVTLMIVEGATLVGPGGRGLERRPRAAMTRAWSIDV